MSELSQAVQMVWPTLDTALHFLEKKDYPAALKYIKIAKRLLLDAELLIPGAIKEPAPEPMKNLDWQLRLPQ